jgi:O-antigen/teichoic acid export membrane protein
MVPGEGSPPFSAPDKPSSGQQAPDFPLVRTRTQKPGEGTSAAAKPGGRKPLKRLTTGAPGRVNLAPPRLQSHTGIPDEFEEDVTLWDTQNLPVLSPELRRLLAAQGRREFNAAYDTGEWSTMLIPGSFIGGGIGGSTAVTQAMAARMMSVAMPADGAVGAPARTDTSAAGGIVASTLVQGIGKLLTYVSALFTMVLVTRMLSQIDYAAYGLAMTLVALVQLVANAGTNRIGVREVAKYPEHADDILNAVLSLRIVTAIVVYGLLAVVVRFLPYNNDDRLATTVIGVSFIFYSMAMALDVVFLPRLKMVVPALADLLAEVFQVVALGALLYYSLTTPVDNKLVFYLVLAITGLGNLVIFVVRWIGAGRLVHLRLSFDTYHWKYLLSISIPFAVVGILEQVQYRADTVVISIVNPGFAGHNIAVYSLAVKIMDIVLTVPVVFIGIAFPALARYAHTDLDRYRRALQRVFNASISLALPAALGLILLAPGIVAIIGSDKYPDAALPLQILACSTIFNFLSTLFSNLIVIYNRQTRLIWAYALNILINVGLNVYLVPTYSYVGSAAITVLTEFLRLASVIIIMLGIFKFRPKLWIVPQTILACLLMAAAVYGLDKSQVIHSYVLFTLVAGSIATIVYALGLWVVGGVDQAVVAKVPFLRR